MSESTPDTAEAVLERARQVAAGIADREAAAVVMELVGRLERAEARYLSAVHGRQEMRAGLSEWRARYADLAACASRVVRAGRAVLEAEDGVDLYAARRELHAAIAALPEGQ